MSVDLLNFRSSSFKELADRVGEYGIPIAFNNMFIGATHNHAGPDINNDLQASKVYKAMLMDSLVSGVSRAFHNMIPGNLKVYRLQATHDLFHNRQEHTENGCILGKSPGGFSDKEIIVKEYFDKNNHSIASTYVIGVHSTILGEFNYHVSGDFAGHTSRHIEESKGADHISLWFYGGGGDQSPRFWHQRSVAFLDQIRSPKALGSELGNEIIAHSDNYYEDDLEIHSKIYPIRLPYKNGRFQERVGYMLSINHKTAIVAAPYELFSKTVFDIKMNSPFENTFLYSNCNGNNGYLPTPDSYGHGCYENSNTKNLKTDAERDFVNDVLQSLQQLHSNYNLSFFHKACRGQKPKIRFWRLIQTHIPSL